MPQIDGPGSRDRFDPHDLQDVQERVVRPVVSSLVKPGDLEGATVGWGPQGDGGWWSPESGRMDLWVVVRAAGETWRSQIWQPQTAEQLATLGAVAWHFADQLEDWICECVYWGELRIADVVIPAQRSA